MRIHALESFRAGVDHPAPRRWSASLIALSVLFVAFISLSVTDARAGDVPPPEETVWLCKPGIADNPCLDGDLGGARYLATGADEPFDYRPARNPGFDCFYVYPTQSEQPRLNADYSRDAELKAVAVNQAAQFSRICDVYAPVYRQYTNYALSQLGGFDEAGIAEIRDIAYDSMRAAFADFISNHSKGRGFVLIGHSQGASHLSRLIDEEIDPNPALRKRMISAIVPGSNNIYVPKGEVIGGNLDNVPACTTGDRLGCVMAWSLYLNRADQGLPNNSSFGRLETGYWVYPEDRPDSETYEVLCVNPGELSGNGGEVTPLANIPAFLEQPVEIDPWSEGRGLYRADCEKGEDASWLDMKLIPGAVDVFGALLTQINSTAGGLHLGDVNLVLGDLITIASRQGARYMNWRKVLSEARSVSLRAGAKAKAVKRLGASRRTAVGACRTNGKRSACGDAKRLGNRIRVTKKAVKRLRARASVLDRRAAKIYDPASCSSVSPLGGEAEAEPRPGPRVC